MKRFLVLLTIISLFSFTGENTKNDVHFDKGYTFLIHQEYSKALEEFDRFINLERVSASPRMDKIAMMYRYKANCLKQLQLFTMSISELQSATTIYHEQNDQAKLALCYGEMASLFGRQGKPGQAIYYLEEALEFYTSIEWLSHIQKSYYELALVHYSMRDFNSTRQELYKALEIRDKSDINFEDTYLEPEIFLLLGNIAWQEENFPLAEKMLSKSDSICRVYLKTLHDKSELFVHIKIARAGYYCSAGEINLATRQLHQADSLCQIPSNEYLKPLVTLEAAKIYELMNDSNSSESLIMSLKEGVEENLNKKTVQDEGISREVIKGIIKFYNERYRQTSNRQDLISKSAMLEKLIHLHKSSVLNYSLFNDFLSNGREDSIYYQQIVETFVQLFTLTRDPEFYHKAFLFSELGYLEMMRSSINYGTQLSPDRNTREELIRIAGLKSQMNNLLGNHQTDEKGKSKEKKEILKLISEIEKRQNRLKINESGLNLTENTFNIQLLELLQKKLGKDEVYLKFFDADQSIYLFIVTNGRFGLTEIHKTSEFRAVIENFNKFINEIPPGEITLQQLTDYCNSGHQLFLSLIQPVREFTPNNTLILEGNGMLNELAFDALLTCAIHPAVISYSGLPFMVYDYTIRGSSSAGLYLNSCSREFSKKRISYAGFAPFSKSDTRESLPGSEKEVKNGSGIFNGKYFAGTTIPKQRVIRMAGIAGIIHLASHARKNELYPQLSELVLSEENDNSRNKLRFYEIAEIPWNQQLVVLGACGTATGKNAVNYGTLSLANAFLTGGAKSVVAARWKVDDYSSEKMMTGFFERIKKGEEFGMALHSTKVAFLKNAPPHLQHPQYWSVYNYIGCSQTLSEPKAPIHRFLIFTSSIFLVAGYLYLQRRNTIRIIRRITDFFKTFQR
jgi:CHAT domain-containing protein